MVAKSTLPSLGSACPVAQCLLPVSSQWLHGLKFLCSGQRNEHWYLAHASGQDIPMEPSYVTKLQVDWAVLFANTLVLAFIFL